MVNAKLYVPAMPDAIHLGADLTLEANGSLDMESLISHRFPLSKAPEVFEKIGAHQLAHQKIILSPEETA
jgi:threonine dehydrogenase-like Zn-dependent dehydrogenase